MPQTYVGKTTRSMDHGELEVSRSGILNTRAGSRSNSITRFL